MCTYLRLWLAGMLALMAGCGGSPDHLPPCSPDCDNGTGTSSADDRLTSADYHYRPLKAGFSVTYQVGGDVRTRQTRTVGDVVTIEGVDAYPVQTGPGDNYYYYGVEGTRLVVDAAL